MVEPGVTPNGKIGGNTTNTKKAPRKYVVRPSDAELHLNIVSSSLIPLLFSVGRGQVGRRAYTIPYRPMASYSDLPLEVQLEINRRLDVASLKSLRLVDRACLVTASQRLFKHVQLWPLIWSWARLESMSYSPFIRDHVETLNFNTNVLDTEYMPIVNQNATRVREKKSKTKSEREEFAIMVREAFKPRPSRGVAGFPCDDETIESLYKKYQTYIEAQDRFIRLDTTAIRHVIRGFPNLETIVCDNHRPTTPDTNKIYNPTIFDRGKDFLDGPSLAGLRLGQYDTSCLGHFYEVCMSTRVRRLSLKHAEWSHLPLSDDETRLQPRDGEQSTQSYHFEAHAYDCQHILDICLENRAYITSTRMHVTYPKRLLHCLSRYTNLETLRLSFGASGFLWDYAEDLMRISASLAKLHLIRLRHLALCNVFTTERSMIQLCENHSTTLRVLELGDIGVGLPQSAAQRESVMSLFWKIRQVAWLERVTLTGLFTNLMDEAWTAASEQGMLDLHSRSCRRSQLEGYLCHQIEWPVGESIEEYLVSREAGQAETESSEAWENAMKPLLWQDGSWKWSGSFIRRCRATILDRISRSRRSRD